jgi:hypothetical protein
MGVGGKEVGREGLRFSHDHVYFQFPCSLVASLDTTHERMLLRAKLKAVGLSNTVRRALMGWGEEKGGGGTKT